MDILRGGSIDYETNAVDAEWFFEITGFLSADTYAEDEDRPSTQDAELAPKQKESWERYATSVCDAWLRVMLSNEQSLDRASAIMQEASPPDELREYHDLWLEVLRERSKDDEHFHNIVVKTAEYPSLIALAPCELPIPPKLTPPQIDRERS